MCVSKRVCVCVWGGWVMREGGGGAPGLLWSHSCGEGGGSQDFLANASGLSAVCACVCV